MPNSFKAFCASSCSLVASEREMPSSSKALDAFLGGPAKRKKPARKDVPAWLALTPAFAMRPVRAAVSSMVAPYPLATGAAYFMVSPIISTLVLHRVAVTAKTSAMWLACSAERPKAVRSSDTISAVLAKSVPPAAAKANKPGIPAIICSVFHPAMPKYDIASAAWVALNWVVSPNFLALSVSL